MSIVNQNVFNEKQALLQKLAWKKLENFVPARRPRQPTKFDRYSDVTPITETLVNLRSFIFPFENFYINASFLKYEKITNSPKFIACQSPLPATIGHFWSLVMQQHVHHIVMLSKLEHGKCEQYWPELGHTLLIEPSDLQLINNCISDKLVSVTCLDEVTQNSITKRTLEIKLDYISQTVTHWQYLDWPDHGAPPNPDIILELCTKYLAEALKNTENSPIIIHCSAGAGRTGTFCTISTAWCLFVQGYTLSIELLADIIAIFKYQRNQHFTVETAVQYIFILKCIASWYPLILK